jgi:hypothetical protein
MHRHIEVAEDMMFVFNKNEIFLLAMVAVLSLISYQHHKCIECGQTCNCIENNSKCLVVSVGYDVILKYI